MKICRYLPQSPFPLQARLGIILENQTLVDPQLCLALDYQREGHFNPLERAKHHMPTSLFRLLSLFDDPIEQLNEAYALYLFFQKLGLNHLKDGTPISFSLNEKSPIQLKAPLDFINSYRDFYTHKKHVQKGFEKRGEEIPKAWYEIPAYYKGNTKSFIGPEEEIPWPKYTKMLDYELELAAIVGRGGYNIKEREACRHIFGYTILNDISARDIQKKEMSIRLGPAKSKDFCSIIGPVITTMDEFDFEEPDLLMTAQINGEQWSRGRSGDGHFSLSQMMAYASQDEWLVPGDLLGSGTVGTGCGLELNRWIQPGDQVELSIEKIGTLKNRVTHSRK